MKETFGEYIRQLRNQKGFTLTQLAAQLNMDSANLSKIENGKREFDFKRIETLVKIFNLDLETVKQEYFSDQFAKTLYETQTNSNALKLAEQKVKYLSQKNLKQGDLKL